MNVRATRSSYSIPAALEVSWSLPTDGAINITGYRIFCVGGQNVHVPPHVSSIVLNFEEISLIESVSIRSESMQLPSELISAIVTTAGINLKLINVSCNHLPNNYYING